jgi:hypothetical protein
MAKYAQNGLRMHLLQSRISKFSGGGLPTREGENTPLGLSPKHANHYITTTTDAVWFFDLTRTRIHDLPHLRVQKSCQHIYTHSLTVISSFHTTAAILVDFPMQD